MLSVGIHGEDVCEAGPLCLQQAIKDGCTLATVYSTHQDAQLRIGVGQRLQSLDATVSAAVDHYPNGCPFCPRCANGL